MSTARSFGIFSPELKRAERASRSVGANVMKRALAGLRQDDQLSLRWQNLLLQQARWNRAEMRITVNERRALQRGRRRDQNIHCSDVSGSIGSQTNRFAPRGFIHVQNLTQQSALTVHFSGTACCIHTELMQAQFKLV